MYKGINLKTASQFDLSKKMGLPPILISFDNNISEEEQRILELFAFAENYNLPDMLNILETIYS